MNPHKILDRPKVCKLELLVGSVAIERMTKRTWLESLFRLLSPNNSDLTLETWRDLETKRGANGTNSAERSYSTYEHRRI